MNYTEITVITITVIAALFTCAAIMTGGIDND